MLLLAVRRTIDHDNSAGKIKIRKVHSTIQVMLSNPRINSWYTLGSLQLLGFPPKTWVPKLQLYTGHGINTNVYSESKSS